MKFSYDAIWIAVEQLVNKNQPESVEKFLLEIKNAAESDKNVDQIIKVFFYKMGFVAQIRFELEQSHHISLIKRHAELMA